MDIHCHNTSSTQTVKTVSAAKSILRPTAFELLLTQTIPAVITLHIKWKLDITNSFTGLTCSQTNSEKAHILFQYMIHFSTLAGNAVSY
jgi:hypothetical protein